MMHCGYEPTASLGLQAKPGDTWKNIKFNFGPQPKPVTAEGVEAFNGVTCGNGHLTGKKKDVPANAGPQTGVQTPPRRAVAVAKSEGELVSAK